MKTAETMYADRVELNRRALVADLGATLGDQPAFRHHVEVVSGRMPDGLAHAIHHRGWIVEPHGDDVALALARHYGHGRRRRRIIAVFLREAAAALRLMPPDVFDPHAWSELALMNVGAITHTPEGEAAGLTRRPSQAVLERRERGCLGSRGAAQVDVSCAAPQLAAPPSLEPWWTAITSRTHARHPARTRSATTPTQWHVSLTAANGSSPRQCSFARTCCQSLGSSRRSLGR